MNKIQTGLKSFPAKMKNKLNKIGHESRSSDKIEGYVYDGIDGSQMAFWECKTDGMSEEHVHDYDEYMTVLQGKYTVILANNIRHEIEKGAEILIPGNTPHAGEFVKNTRTIHWFGGKRALRVK
jgi:quercetin dioxygenase-like cupin family protein